MSAFAFTHGKHNAHVGLKHDLGFSIPSLPIAFLWFQILKRVRYWKLSVGLKWITVKKIRVKEWQKSGSAATMCTCFI